MAKIMIVEWDDPAGFLGWVNKKEAGSKKPGRVVSVGFLVKETKKKIVLAGDSMDGGKEFNGINVIPKKAIKNKYKVG